MDTLTAEPTATRQPSRRQRHATPGRKPPQRSKTAFLGGYVSPEQKEKAQRLAAAHGCTLQGLIGILIDQARLTTAVTLTA